MVVGFPLTRLNKRNKANLKPPKNSQKNEKSETDKMSVSLSCEQKKAGKSTLLGAMVDAAFFQAVDAAAKKCGVTRSNFVRSAIARAVRDAGVAIDDSSATSYRGQQTAPKAEVCRRAASARAVKLWKQGLRKRHDAFTADAIAQTWDNAAAKVGRKLRIDELEQCEREIVAALRAAAGMGGGPPVFPGLC